MPFTEEILQYRSLAIAGLEKNTGKTECLNYILRKLATCGKKIAITSIGLDGENTDQLSADRKPEITIYDGMVFVTSEKHFRQRKIHAEILEISQQRTATGRLVVAEARSTGKSIIAGPSTASWLQKVIMSLPHFGVHTTLVDGAFSRLSFASPWVVESLVLTTGATLSTNLQELVNQTAFAVELINLPEYQSPAFAALTGKEEGVYTVDAQANIYDTGVKSLLLKNSLEGILEKAGTIYVSGAITDKLLELLKRQKNLDEITLVAKDFTKMFVSKNTFRAFRESGGQLRVLKKIKLIAVCINPVSTHGQVLESARLISILREKIQTPVYNIMELEA
jgi:hypothetical protein